MNKKIFTGSLLLGASLLFSACTLPTSSTKTIETSVDSDTTITTTTETGTTATPTPTLSKDNSVDSIETELKSTVILDEDFSDI